MIKKLTYLWGIIGLILSILGLILVIKPYFGIVLSIVAVVFYFIQRKYKKTWSAFFGLILGIVGIILNGFLLFVLYIIIMIINGIGK